MITIDQFVEQNVHYCVSGLIYTLAQGMGQADEVCEEAFDLFTPVVSDDDYIEAVEREGYSLYQDPRDGKWTWTWLVYTPDPEAEGESDFLEFLDAEGGEFFATKEEAAQDCCEDRNLDVDFTREIYEHWIVSPFLADKLEAQGERVNFDFWGLTIWGRPTTGQSISLDSVIQEIYREL